MSETVRRCLGCSATYPPDEPACPKCGSYAADAEVAEPKPKERSRSTPGTEARPEARPEAKPEAKPERAPARPGRPTRRKG